MSLYPQEEPTGIFIDLDESQPQYRHSLFFQTEQETLAAKLWVDEMIDPSNEGYGPTQDQDTDIWEYRFYTSGKLTNREQRFLLHATEMKTLSSYALNVED